MVIASGIFSRLAPRKVMVVGDFVLDRYTIGKAKRISPEAPVAVLNVISEEQRPGGAGNVVLNLISLGAEVVAVGRVGNDEAGTLLNHILAAEGADVTGLFNFSEMATPVKNRMIADNQQIVRVDYETVTPISTENEQRVLNAIPRLFQGVEIVAISDYGKGFLSNSILRAVIDEARLRGIPIVTDPKSSDFSKYRGSTIVKPNFSEAVAASGLESNASLDDVARQILRKVKIDYLMVTRSQAGISIFPDAGAREDFLPVRVREIKDVTGAGDTVLAILTFALANGLSIPEATTLSNIAAGIAIERFGCARITIPELAHRLLDLDEGNKIFGQEHLCALERVLFGRNCALIIAEVQNHMSIELFKEIYRLAHDEKYEVVVALNQKPQDDSLLTMIASLREVSFIVMSDQNAEQLSRILSPRCVVDMKTIDVA